MNEELVVTRANRLVEASYRLNISEQRVIALLVTHIHPDDEEFKPYIFTVGDLGELIATHGTKDTADLHDSSHGRVFVHAVTQLEIASTEIRELIAAGRDPRFLMPDAVRNVILESGCYN